MNKRNITYMVVCIVKIMLLSAIVLPIVLWAAEGIYELIHGQPVNAAIRDMATVGLAVMMGVTASQWIFGHRPAVDAYYSEVEKDDKED